MQLPTELEALKIGLAAIKSGWIQKSYAKDSAGFTTWGADRRAICWCSAGAIQKVAYTPVDIPYDWVEQDISRYKSTKLHNRVLALLEVEMDGNVVKYNDTHTYDEVVAAWERAIEKETRRCM